MFDPATGAPLEPVSEEPGAMPGENMDPATPARSPPPPRLRTPPPPPLSMPSPRLDRTPAVLQARYVPRHRMGRGPVQPPPRVRRWEFQLFVALGLAAAGAIVVGSGGLIALWWWTGERLFAAVLAALG